MKRNLLATVVALSLALLGPSVSLAAPPLTVVPSATQCSAGGGVIVLQVTFAFAENAPVALGLQLVLPAGWSLVATEGTHVPQVAPAAGDTGALGWAYLELPEKSAEFSIALRYPAGVNAEQVLRAMAIWRPAPPDNPAELKIAIAAP